MRLSVIAQPDRDKDWTRHQLTWDRATGSTGLWGSCFVYSSEGQRGHKGLDILAALTAIRS